MAEAKHVRAGQLSELRTALREVSDEIADVVHAELEDIAKTVAADARSRVPRNTGKAAATYRAEGATVTWGTGVAYVPWLEFGGAVGRKKSIKRPYQRKGRYVYPAIAEHMADVEKRIDDLIEAVTGGYLEVE